MTENITAALRPSSKVRSISCGSTHDWIVITDPSGGPQPNPVDVFVDHTDEYDVTDKTHTEDATFVHVAEVEA